MIHLACVVDEVEAARAVCGSSRSEGVLVMLSDELACAGRGCDGPVPPTDPQALVDHDQLVQQLMRSCRSVVPFRYGTVVPDARSVAAELAPRAGQFLDLLAWLRDRVELALRAAPAASPPLASSALALAAAASSAAASSAAASSAAQRDVGAPTTQTGRSYLQACRVRTEREPLKELHRTLAGSAVAAVAEPVAHGALRASYLVDASEVDGFCRALDRATAGIDGLGPVSLTGPWAPYTFAATIEDHRPPAAVGSSMGERHA